VQGSNADREQQYGQRAWFVRTGTMAMDGLNIIEYAAAVKEKGHPKTDGPEKHPVRLSIH